MAVQEPVLATIRRQSDLVLREMQAELAQAGHRISIAHDSSKLAQRPDLSGRKRCLDADDPHPRTRSARRSRGRTRLPLEMLIVIGAMDNTGMMAVMTVEAATDREVFLAYLDKALCPKLRSGHAVVMDNLSAHKVEDVRERIEACGASLLYLPPYSADLNPIRKGLVEAQTGTPRHGRAHRRPAASGNRRPVAHHHPRNATARFRLPLKGEYL